MVHEIPVARRRLRSDQGEAPGQPGQRQGTVHVQHTLLAQPLQGPLPGQFHLPEREGRVDILDAQAHPVDLRILHPHQHQHRHSDFQPAARPLVEGRLDQRPPRPPDDRLDLCAEQIPPSALLHQFQVAVPVIVHFHIMDFRPHPYRNGEIVRHSPTYSLQQPGQCDVFLHIP